MTCPYPFGIYHFCALSRLEGAASSRVILNQTLMKIGEYSLNTTVPCSLNTIILRHSLHCHSEFHSRIESQLPLRNLLKSIFFIYFLLFLSHFLVLPNITSIKVMSQGLFVRFLYLSGLFRETKLIKCIYRERDLL